MPRPVARLDASAEVKAALVTVLTVLIDEVRGERNLTEGTEILAAADDMLRVATGRLLDHALVMHDIATSAVNGSRSRPSTA